MLKAVLAAAGAIALAAPALAQTAQTQPPQQQEQVAAAATDFVNEAASMGMAEVALGEMAMQKAQSPQVKEFAQHIMQDHSRNNQKLQAAAQQAGATIPAQPKPQEQQAIAKLEGMSGQEFDRAFMEQMVKDHQKAVDLYQRQAQNNPSPQLQAYARETLPALQQHLQQAQQLAQSPQ